MLFTKRNASYSGRAWIAALFLFAALILGGGGSRHPGPELALELLFVVAAGIWLWRTPDNSPSHSLDAWLAIAIASLILLLPVLQLIPVPPGIWQALPGRENEIEALRLIGGADTWRPISMVPLDTLASLLAMVPAVGMLVAVSRLSLVDRRPILLVVLLVAFLTAIFGSAQIAAAQGDLTLYSRAHAGWVTGFQANRNHAAQILLAGLLALAAMSRLMVSDRGMRLPRDLSPKTFSIMAGGLALVLFAALVMTGSRSGVALLLIVAAGVTLVLLVPLDGRGRLSLRAPVIVLACLALFALAGYYLFAAENTSLGRVAARFADFEDNREKVWADAAFALRQYWPVGIGAGGFIEAMFPAERLEFLDATYPNQAHNDFLEIGIEGGLAAYLLLSCVLLLVVILAVRHWRMEAIGEAKVQIIFAATVLISLTLHSVVDYPLRSMSISCLAGAACGMLTRTSGISGSRRVGRMKGH